MSGAPLRIRFVDLCAGLGGFHLGLMQADVEQLSSSSCDRRIEFECVFAAEIDSELSELYVRNFPDIASTYMRLFPRERVAGVRGLESLYAGETLKRVHGDLRDLLDETDATSLRRWPDAEAHDDFIVPEHDLLCAGFPCQPFSKSGGQRGFADLNGTVFQMIAAILRHRRPRYVFLENVGNFERHDGGNTWQRVRSVLEDDLGYDIRFTGHMGSSRSGTGLLSPHDFGMPHHRGRFFVVGQLRDVQPFSPDDNPFPQHWRSAADPARERRLREKQAASSLIGILTRGARSASASELRGAQVSPEREKCIDHWCKLLSAIRDHGDATGTPIRMPSSPIWGYELDPWNHYPIETNPMLVKGDHRALARARASLLSQHLRSGAASTSDAPVGDRSFLRETMLSEPAVARWVETWPPYAGGRRAWPRWKQQFIADSRQWGEALWRNLDRAWLRYWLEQLYAMPASFQKLEWNCQGEDLDLRRHVLQFRPSGLRVKRLTSIPALVAMTSTQIPIVPHFNEEASAPVQGLSRSRHILLMEALELQGFPPAWQVPRSRDAAFKALGNAVHVGLVARVVSTWLHREDQGVAHSVAPHTAVQLAHGANHRGPSSRSMAPVFDGTLPQTHRRMSSQRSRDTGPEMRLRRALFSRGFRYRVHVAPLPGLRRSADIVFPRQRLAIFVDGCYWHGCPDHGTQPRVNASYWSAKIALNKQRDADTTKRLESAGWRVLRVWEHEDMDDVATVVAELVRKVPELDNSPNEMARGSPCTCG